MTQPSGQLPRPPRVFRADHVLSGQVRLDGYPFRYIALTAEGHLGNQAFDVVLSAVEFLETVGWELVNFTDNAHFDPIAYLRRRL
ncbi:hypothetical protein ACIBL3_41495 [Kribbella sp. NPDC050124]|uniref:hypothetical protein n=1 Tax=Kribbella sp. NPDC050124 TaxID=3364114 RepID=UPI003795E3FF